jgi:VIT1/CCC1 family predicted Fe2+/Mn2+ transporter
MFENVNELAVLVSAMLSVAIGSIWYSPLLFGKSWMRLAGLTVEDEDIPVKEASILAGKGVVIQSVFFYIIAQFISLSKAGTLPLATLGVFILILLLSYMMSVVVWERKLFSYFLIHAGYGALAVATGIGIIAFWPW